MNLADVVPTPEERQIGKMMAQMIWNNLMPHFDRMRDKLDDQCPATLRRKRGRPRKNTTVPNKDGK